MDDYDYGRAEQEQRDAEYEREIAFTMADNERAEDEQRRDR